MGPTSLLVRHCERFLPRTNLIDSVYKPESTGHIGRTIVDPKEVALAKRRLVKISMGSLSEYDHDHDDLYVLQYQHPVWHKIVAS